MDVGGFDGFTSEEFIRLHPNYGGVYIYEPDPINFARCEARFANNAKVKVVPFGAGSKEETVRFDQAGSASAISSAGETLISVRPLDEMLPEAPAFIKIDIEGAELAALEGAKKAIAEHTPTLAVCVYHKPSHFWEIPKTVLAMHSEYDVFVRHYTESIYETVMFFVPKRK